MGLYAGNGDMVQSTTAIFENGSLKFLKPLQGIPEHAVVRVTVETVSPPSVQEQLDMLRAVPVAKELASSIETGRNQPWRVDEF